jgi:hypothetical protein
MPIRTYIRPILMIALLWHGLGAFAEACPACGSGDERFNKPLADLRIIYEKKGRDALPYIKEVLRTSTDPLVIRRAAGYIVELRDRASIPLFEDMLLALTKRVAFSSFGLDTYDFQGRLAIAHALAKFGPTNVGDRIWKKYDRLELNRKSEVPYLLNALEDSKLVERLLSILSRAEDHLLMVGALNVLEIGGNQQALPILRSKVVEWRNKGMKITDNPNPKAPVLYYSVLRIMAERAISEIEERVNK